MELISKGHHHVTNTKRYWRLVKRLRGELLKELEANIVELRFLNGSIIIINVVIIIIMIIIITINIFINDINVMTNDDAGRLGNYSGKFKTGRGGGASQQVLTFLCFSIFHLTCLLHFSFMLLGFG